MSKNCSKLSCISNQKKIGRRLSCGTNLQLVHTLKGCTHCRKANLDDRDEFEINDFPKDKDKNFSYLLWLSTIINNRIRPNKYATNTSWFKKGNLSRCQEWGCVEVYTSNSDVRYTSNVPVPFYPCWLSKEMSGPGPPTRTAPKYIWWNIMIYERLYVWSCFILVISQCTS